MNFYLIAYNKIGVPGRITRHIHVARPSGRASRVQLLLLLKLSNLKVLHPYWQFNSATTQESLWVWRIGAPGRIRTCYPRLSIPSTAFAAWQNQAISPLCEDDTYHVSLWSGLSLHHFRCHTYSLYGTLRKSLAKWIKFAWLFLGVFTLKLICEP